MQIKCAQGIRKRHTKKVFQKRGLRMRTAVQIRAIRYLEEFQDQDFFLTVSYDEPHGPSLCPAPFNHMYDGFQFEHNPSFQDDLSKKKPFMQRLWAGKESVCIRKRRSIRHQMAWRYSWDVIPLPIMKSGACSIRSGRSHQMR